ncbi:MAG: coenzyme F420-0:L-glutamate ligase [Candidatus Paceibacterota bacterium]
MKIKAIKTRVFKEREDLLSFILKYVKKLPEKSVLVVTSKIVALAEGRTAEFVNEKQKIDLIKEESDFTIKTKVVWMTIKDGMVLASAGIDESNAGGKLILLPKDSFKNAEFLRKKIMQKFRLKNLGVVITDSRLMPLRAGALGIALGFAGFHGIRNYVGTKDIFGRIMKISKTNVVDSLATTAVLCMGEGDEQQPLAVITDAPVIFSNKVKRREIMIDPQHDIYAPLFTGLHLNKNAKEKKN